MTLISSCSVYNYNQANHLQVSIFTNLKYMKALIEQIECTVAELTVTHLRVSEFTC